MLGIFASDEAGSDRGQGMKFSNRQDIEAPIGFVFGQLTDFPAIERAAMRRGAEVQRVDSLNGNGPGMMWDARFDLRGKPRELQLELTEYDPPNGLSLASNSANLELNIVADLVALSRGSTRLAMDFELKARNLSGKLLVQSLRLARKNLTGRVQDRLAGFAKEIGERYRRSA